MCLLLSNAVVGLLVTLVYKLGNAVVKTLALSASSALLLLLPLLWDHLASASLSSSSSPGSFEMAAAAGREDGVEDVRDWPEERSGTSGAVPCLAAASSLTVSRGAATAQTFAGCAVVLVAAIMFMEHAPPPHATHAAKG